MSAKKYDMPNIRGAGRTMLSVQKSTKEELMKIGHMGDSFDSVINKLIDHWKKTHK
jgi:hypothetical protein